MLFLLRQQAPFRRRIALGIALVLFFLVTVGEALHYKHHERVSGKIAAAQSVSVRGESGTPHLAAAQTKDYCSLCEWEAVPFSTAAPVLTFLAPLFLPLLFARFVEKPLFFVRLTLALRGSRGPPVFAV